jgi:putative transposase
MPDHLHLLWMGLRMTTDQMNAIKFLRVQLEPELGEGRQWQAQAHDHVLREVERERGALARVCTYILQNPERAALLSEGGKWPYLGCVVPGYPRLDPLDEAFWPLYWRLHIGQLEAEKPS